MDIMDTLDNVGLHTFALSHLRTHAYGVSSFRTFTAVP